MPNLIQKAKTAIFYDMVDGQKMFAGGLLPHIDDQRDLKLGIFGWGEYKPLHQRHRIQTLSSKNQFRNTCTMNGVVLQKEQDENTVLNVMLHVQKMKQLGYISGDGFSDLRSNQIAVQKFGIPEKGFANEDVYDWNKYSAYGWTPEIEANALSHRSHSFWNTSAKNEILKLLDENKVLASGSEWYSGFNMRGGFSSPWIITKPIGQLVGGHAYDIVGYDQNYQGYGMCLIFQNSYGRGYGDNGDLYMPIDFALRFIYTCYVQLDIELDVARFLEKYEGKFVKAQGKPAIYKIQDGKKSPLPDMVTYFSWGGARKGYEVVTTDELQAVPEGGVLEMQYSPYWPMIKDLTSNISELTMVVNDALEFEKNFPNT